MLIVIKIGSNILTTSDNKLDLNNLRALCEQLFYLKNACHDLLVVSSGAIVSGSERLQLKPMTMPEKQAAASVGQALLTNAYNNFLSIHGLLTSQILLTKDAFHHETQRENIHNTLKTLIKLNVIPIINENDTVAIDEIRFGDNDMLSAEVAILINADRLIILSDIDGLFNKNPRWYPDAVFISKVDLVTKEIISMADGNGSEKGTGGMITKINAAKLANDHGIDTIIANGRSEKILQELVCMNNPLGTLFKSQEETL